MQRSLPDGSESFEVTVLEVASSSRVVLFSVGRGGDPARHLPLLSALAELGCIVVAPHFERLASPVPSEHDLSLRARRLRLALDAVAPRGASVVGVGHSIGATMLLALAGGRLWLRAGHALDIAPDERLERLALFAPATGFFQAPGALDALRTPIVAWAGTADSITPPTQAEALREVLAPRVPVDVRVVEDAGHFSFMHAPPPQTTEPLADREGFLTQLTADVCRFVRG